MIKMYPFSLGHLDFFNPKVEYVDLWNYMAEAVDNPSMDLISVLYENKVLCIAGCTDVREKTGEVWIMVDQCIEKYKIKFVKAIKILIDKYLKESRGYERLQMATDTRFPERSRFAEYLGFEYEGTMKKFFQGQDHHLYARLL